MLLYVAHLHIEAQAGLQEKESLSIGMHKYIQCEKRADKFCQITHRYNVGLLGKRRAMQ